MSPITYAGFTGPYHRWQSSSAQRNPVTYKALMAFLGQERVAEHAPARHGGLARIDADHLYRHMIGAGLDISVELLDDGVQVAPEHEVVDEPVAAAVGDVLLRVAQPAELRNVELAVQVNVQVFARDRAGLVGVGLEQHGVFDTQERVRPEDLPRLCGVCRGDLVAKGAGRTVASQLEHLGPVCSQ